MPALCRHRFRPSVGNFDAESLSVTPSAGNAGVGGTGPMKRKKRFVGLGIAAVNGEHWSSLKLAGAPCPGFNINERIQCRFGCQAVIFVFFLMGQTAQP